MSDQYSAETQLMIELTNGKIYEGRFCYENNLKITVTDVSEYPSKTKYDNVLHFYKMEILSIKVLKEGISNIQFTGSDENITVNYEDLKELINNYIYLSVVDSRFPTVISNLKLCTEITVFGFGSAFGRNYRISILAIGTLHEIFLFDIKLAGDRAFNEGLRDILQSTKIKKVVHNCKVLADCLEYAHKVKLQNVFDTQVVDYTLTLKQGIIIEKMKSFADCVYQYLNISKNVIRSAEISQKQLYERPLPENLKVNASILVAHLHTLKEVLFNIIMLRINLITDCYMNCMRNEEHASSLKYLMDDVPQEIKDLNIE